jgi:hypothetical protein
MPLRIMTGMQKLDIVRAEPDDGLGGRDGGGPG